MYTGTHTGTTPIPQEGRVGGIEGRKREEGEEEEEEERRENERKEPACT